MFDATMRTCSMFSNSLFLKIRIQVQRTKAFKYMDRDQNKMRIIE